jgi:hypothetical protein
VFESLVEVRERITETPLFIADGDQAVPATTTAPRPASSSTVADE